MRYPPDQRDKSRRRILSVASRMFRESGYRATGVAAIMKAAGMTAGGFYAHFPSKEALFRESLAPAFDEFRKRLTGALEGRVRSVSSSELVRRYLDVEKTAEAGESCPINALAADIARSGEGVRERFEDELRKTAEAVAARTRKPGVPADDAALALLALCSGAILLRRAMESPEMENRMVEACVSFAERAGGR
ncbi:MAG TPA: helix-turn-helix domain-containing protein [Thermoanaerobaculia bacterium]